MCGYTITQCHLSTTLVFTRGWRLYVFDLRIWWRKGKQTMILIYLFCFWKPSRMTGKEPAAAPVWHLTGWSCYGLRCVRSSINPPRITNCISRAVQSAAVLNKHSGCILLCESSLLGALAQCNQPSALAPLPVCGAAQRHDCKGRKWAFSSSWLCDSGLQFPKFMTRFEQPSYRTLVISRKKHKCQIMTGDLPGSSRVGIITIQKSCQYFTAVRDTFAKLPLSIYCVFNFLNSGIRISLRNIENSESIWVICFLVRGLCLPQI